MPVPLLPQTTLDLTQLDRQSMLSRVQQLWYQANPNHEDFTPNYAENLLLEAAVLLLDSHRATMEYRVRQLMWSTLNERLAAARIGRLSGFSLTGAGAAAVSLRLTSADATTTAAEVVVAAGTRIRTMDPSNPKEYTVTSTVTKAAAASYVDVLCENATSVTEQYSANGSPNQECAGSNQPYIESSIVVTDTIGAFTLVPSFLGLTDAGLPIAAGTAVCNLLVDDRGFPIIRFGNGITGRLPSGTITVAYKYGGGVAGAVAAGTRWQLLDTLSHSGTGLPANFAITNAAASTPGTDPMTTNEARVLGPLSMRTINRCITKEDFEFVAKLVPGVARAALLTSDEDPTITPDTAELHLVAYGSQYTSGAYAPAASAATKIAAVEALFAPTGTYPALMGVNVSAYSAPFKTINVSCEVYKKSGYTGAQVLANITAALQDFFAVADGYKYANDKIDFGFRMTNAAGDTDYLIQWSIVLNAVLDTAGVRGISTSDTAFLLNDSRAAVALLPNEFPILGTVTVEDMDTGLPMA